MAAVAARSQTLFGKARVQNSVSLPPPFALQGYETAFRGMVFPNRSLGTKVAKLLPQVMKKLRIIT